MPSTHIVFLGLHGCREPKKYMQEKLTSYFRYCPSATQSKIGAIIDSVITPELSSGKDAATIPIARPADLPQLAEAKARVLEAKKKIMLSQLNILSPLLANESVVEERFSYLVDDYAGAKKRAPVFVRKTNMATVAYIFGNAEITQVGELVYSTEGRTPQDTEAPPAEAANGLNPEQLCENLAKGIAGALPPPYNIIGSALLEALFPEDQGPDYKQLIDDFANVVKDANRQQSVTEQAGVMNGVLQYMENTYEHEKKGGQPKAELIELLKTQLLKLQDVIGILGHWEYAKAGLAYYVPSVSLFTDIHQEMCLVDCPQDPKKSMYKDILVDNLRDHKRLADSTFQSIKSDITTARDTHLSKISGVQDNPYCDAAGSGVVCKSRYYFEDSGATPAYRSPYYEQCGCHDNPESRCQAARDSYYAGIKKQYDDKLAGMQWILDSLAAWDKVLQNPIPV